MTDFSPPFCSGFVYSIRGHGTYSEDNKLWASVAGVVERVNKLISVKPLRSRYNPDIGDLVVGRITSVRFYPPSF